MSLSPLPAFANTQAANWTPCGYFHHESFSSCYCTHNGLSTAAKLSMANVLRSGPLSLINLLIQQSANSAHKKRTWGTVTNVLSFTHQSPYCPRRRCNDSCCPGHVVHECQLPKEASVVIVPYQFGLTVDLNIYVVCSPAYETE